jgi:lipase ATG15
MSSPLQSTFFQPNVTDKAEILALAELASNAYVSAELRNTSSWRNSSDMYTYEFSYGWDVDGLRGHVFQRNKSPFNIVIGVKGTSLNSKKDKESANLICSCNCCFSNCTNECDRDRLLESLPNMYLTLLLEATDMVEKLYPGRQIWYTGHSMGSVIGSLAAMKTCRHFVGFSAPGEQLFASRIGLEHKCDEDYLIHHVGYYKDPIFVGKCGWLCAIAGYRMDSQCHHGTECIYTDSAGDEGDDDDDGGGDWDGGGFVFPEQMEDFGSGLIYSHTIKFLIDKVITPSDSVPQCVPVNNCSEVCRAFDEFRYKPMYLVSQ